MDWLSYCALWVFSFMVVTVDSTEDFTRRRLHKGWVTGNRHSVLDGIIGRYKHQLFLYKCIDILKNLHCAAFQS